MGKLRRISLVAMAVLKSAAILAQCSATLQSGVPNQLNFARCLAAEGKLDQASEQIAQYRSTHPQDADGAVAQAELLLLKNDLSDAMDVLDRISLAHPKSIEVMTAEAEVARRMNDADKTERLLKLCTEIAPDNVEVWKHMGDFYLRKQPTSAISAFTKALRLHPDDALALAGRAAAESDTHLTSEAERDFAHSISLNQAGGHPDAMVDLLYADFLSSSNKKRESIAAYDRTIRENELLEDAYLGRAKAEISLQEWKRATTDLERIASDRKYTITALALLVKAYKGEGNADKATEVSTKLERVSAEDDASRSAGHEIAYQLQTATGLMRDGNCDKAIQIDQSLLKIHPEAASAYLQSGMCYFQLGRLDEAEAALRKYLEFDKNSAQAHTTLGRSLVRAGKIDLARDQFNTARLIDPLMVEASLGLAACSIRQQKLEEAEKILRAVVALSGGSTDAHLMLAECLYKQHHPQSAMEEVSKTLAIDPSNQAALQMKAALSENAKP